MPRLLHILFCRFAMACLLASSIAIGLGVPAWAQAPAELPAAAANNPAVELLLARPRPTASDSLQAVVQLLNLGYPELAQSIFEELLALPLDDQQRADLVSEHGSATLLQLSRSEVLAPEGASFAAACLQAAEAQASRPDRIAALIAQLGELSSSRRRAALRQLSQVGTPAVVPCLQALGNPTTSAEQRTGLRAALIRLAPLSTGSLLAALDSGEPQLIAEAALLLSHLAPPQAAARLARPALTDASGQVAAAYESLTDQPAQLTSAERLLRRTLDHLAHGVPAFRTAGREVQLWIWDQHASQPVAVPVSSQGATLVYRAQLAIDLAQLRPDVERDQLAAMRLALEADQLLHDAGLAGASLASPFQERWRTLPVTAIQRLLADALAEQQFAAAVATLHLVAKRRDPAFLRTATGQPSAVASALQGVHPSVRHATLHAIAAIDPSHPFPGASSVVPALERLVSTHGGREVVAAAPRLDVATNWVGGLAKLGFSGQVATTGREGVELAQQRPDVELVLIDMSISQPPVRDVVFQLRRHPSTALVPIGLLAREGQLATARLIADDHERVQVFPYRHEPAVLVHFAEQLHQQLPRDWPTPDERLAQANDAVTWIAQLLQQERDFYRLHAVGEPVANVFRQGGSTARAATVLALLGTYESQLALVDVASRPSFPLVLRQDAAAAFAQSVAQFGVVLPAADIERQYQRYNASGSQPAEIQQLLGQLLDTIEAPRQQLVAPPVSDPLSR